VTNQSELIRDAHKDHSAEEGKIGSGQEYRAESMVMLRTQNSGGGGGGQIPPNPHDRGASQQMRRKQMIRDFRMKSQGHRESH